MDRLLDTEDTPLIRTAFGDDAAWQSLLADMAKEASEGFRAYVSIVSDLSFENSSAETLARTVALNNKHSIALIADDKAMNISDQTLLVIGTAAPHPLFRVSVRALWMVENNLSIANMDFVEFTGALDETGVFRGPLPGS